MIDQMRILRANPSKRPLVDNDAWSPVEYLEQDYDGWAVRQGAPLKGTYDRCLVVHIAIQDVTQKRLYDGPMFTVKSNHECHGELSHYCPERDQAKDNPS